MQFSPKTINFTPGQWAQGGSGVSPLFPWFGSPFLDMTAANFPTLAGAVGLALGDFWWNNGVPGAAEGNAFMIVKANAALTVGQLVAMDAPQSGTYTSAGSTASRSVTNITEAQGVNGDVGNWLSVLATGQTVPQIRLIKANTNGANAVFTISLPDFLRPNSPNDLDTWTTTPTNADPLTVIRPWQVRVCTAALNPIGVALGTVTSGSFTVIQVAGLAGVSATATVGITAMTTLVTPAAAGVLNGFAGTATALTGTAASNQMIGASIVPLITLASGSAMIPCMVNFIGA